MTPEDQHPAETPRAGVPLDQISLRDARAVVRRIVHGEPEHTDPLGVAAFGSFV